MSEQDKLNVLKGRVELDYDPDDKPEGTLVDPLDRISQLEAENGRLRLDPGNPWRQTVKDLETQVNQLTEALREAEYLIGRAIPMDSSVKTDWWPRRARWLAALDPDEQDDDNSSGVDLYG